MSEIRTFDSGATRDSDDGKPDYEGFLSPFVLEAYGRYMHHHRVQSDGTIRASDNWQRGIDPDVYMKSAWRHFFDLWKLHRGLQVIDRKDGHEVSKEEACCALMFNVMGYLHETIKQEVYP